MTVPTSTELIGFLVQRELAVLNSVRIPADDHTVVVFAGYITVNIVIAENDIQALLTHRVADCVRQSQIGDSTSVCADTNG